MAIRRGERGVRRANVRTIVGNLLLFLFTLAVAALVTYLVLFPPGVIR